MRSQARHFRCGPGSLKWSMPCPYQRSAEIRTRRGVVQVVHTVHEFLKKLFALYTTLFSRKKSQSLHISSNNLSTIDHIDRIDQGSNGKDSIGSMVSKNHGPNPDGMDQQKRDEK